MDICSFASWPNLLCWVKLYSGQNRAQIHTEMNFIQKPSPGSRLRDIQRWSSLIQNNFRSVSALFITWKSLNSADSALNSAENENFQSQDSALKSVDSELFLSETALFSSETALNFSVLNSADSEKIRADQRWNRADQRWCFSFPLNQHWKTSKLWNSAVQRWLSLELQPGSH